MSTRFASGYFPIANTIVVFLATMKLFFFYPGGPIRMVGLGMVVFISDQTQSLSCR